MTPSLLEGPAGEPVTLAEMKAHLRLDSDDEDALVASLIIAARLTVEAASGCELIAQKWRLSLDALPRDNILRLPLRPVMSCDAVRVFADATTAAALAPADYYLDAAAQPPRLIFVGSPPASGRAASGIEIDLTLGFGADAENVPEPLRLATRLLAARWFERRGDEDFAGVEKPLPPDVVALIAPFREPRL